MSATTTFTTPPKQKLTAMQRAMLVHELEGEFVQPDAKVNVIKTDVIGVPGAYVLKNVLTPEECQKFIDACESIEFTEAPVSTGLNTAVFSDIRDNKRVMATMSEASLALLQSRISDFIEREIELGGHKWHAIDGAAGLNERLRFYKYEVGTEFKPHFDGCFPRSEQEISCLTFIIYLNGGLDGGQTEFYMKTGDYKVNPETGQALCFHHRGQLSPYHAGLPHNSQGKCKYVLRSDLMYRKGEAIPYSKPQKK